MQGRLHYLRHERMFAMLITFLYVASPAGAQSATHADTATQPAALSLRFPSIDQRHSALVVAAVPPSVFPRTDRTPHARPDAATPYTIQDASASHQRSAGKRSTLRWAVIGAVVGGAAFGTFTDLLREENAAGETIGDSNMLTAVAAGAALGALLGAVAGTLVK